MIVAAVALIPATATAATPRDGASAHAGLRAYRAFASSLGRKVPAARSGDAALIRAVRAKCPRVLESVSFSDTLVEGVATQFGKEVAADLLVSAFASFREPLATLRLRLARLQWSRPAIARRLERAVDAEDRFFAHMPSDLCGNASALVANGGRRVPPGTRAFLGAYQREAELAARLDVKSFLLRYRRPDDKRLVRLVNRLEARADVLLGDIFAADVPRLLNALGLFV